MAKQKNINIGVNSDYIKMEFAEDDYDGRYKEYFRNQYLKVCLIIYDCTFKVVYGISNVYGIYDGRYKEYLKVCLIILSYIFKIAYPRSNGYGIYDGSYKQYLRNQY